MATDTLTGGIRPVTLPNQFPPMPAVARILSRFDRAQLAGFIAVAIDLADAMDGDPDAEANGTEDDFVLAWWQNGDGPGCKIADPDSSVDDTGEENGDYELDEGYYDPPIPMPGGGSGDC